MSGSRVERNSLKSVGGDGGIGGGVRVRVHVRVCVFHASSCIN